MAGAEGWEDIEDFGKITWNGLDSMVISNKTYSTRYHCQSY